MSQCEQLSRKDISPKDRSEDFLLVWFTGSLSYSDVVSLNHYSLGHIPLASRLELKKNDCIQVKAGQGMMDAKVLARGTLAQLQKISKRLDAKIIELTISDSDADMDSNAEDDEVESNQSQSKELHYKGALGKGEASEEMISVGQNTTNSHSSHGVPDRKRSLFESLPPVDTFRFKQRSSLGLQASGSANSVRLSGGSVYGARGSGGQNKPDNPSSYNTSRPMNNTIFNVLQASENTRRTSQKFDTSRQKRVLSEAQDSSDSLFGSENKKMKMEDSDNIVAVHDETTHRLLRNLISEMRRLNDFYRVAAGPPEINEDLEDENEYELYDGSGTFRPSFINRSCPNGFAKEFLYLRYGKEYLTDKLLLCRGKSDRSTLPYAHVQELRNIVLSRFPRAVWPTVVLSVNQALRDLSRRDKI